MNPLRAHFILLIWAESLESGGAVWRGCLENAAGARFHFASLETLNELVTRAGWRDAPLVNTPMPAQDSATTIGELQTKS